MRLRNWKETVPQTIEDILQDVHPESLDVCFHWYAPLDSPVWVFAGEGRNKKWRQGFVYAEGEQLFLSTGIFRRYEIAYAYKRKVVIETFAPGIQWEMKPDTPEVRVLLREAGVFV